MITKKEVQHIAKLARLGLTSKELEEMREELNSILDYMEKLKEVDISKVEPVSHLIKIENTMREDEIKSQKYVPRRTEGSGAGLKVKSQKLLELAPETKNGYLKVKSIF